MASYFWAWYRFSSSGISPNSVLLSTTDLEISGTSRSREAGAPCRGRPEAREDPAHPVRTPDGWHLRGFAVVLCTGELHRRALAKLGVASTVPVALMRSTRYVAAGDRAGERRGRAGARGVGRLLPAQGQGRRAWLYYSSWPGLAHECPVKIRGSNCILYQRHGRRRPAIHDFTCGTKVVDARAKRCQARA
jgi:hypothetical protein